MSTVIAVRGLTKRFGEVLAVDDVSFEVRAGRVTAFLGPNGAGKTTTLRMLLGLVTPSAGTATIDGKRYDELSEPVSLVGAVLESSGFHPGRRAVDHLRVQAVAAGLPAERAEAVLALVGLGDVARRRVGGFSLGMRQRLGLASALLGEPRVLILDEPANGLDPEGVHWLRRFLRVFVERGGTVLVSSHLLAEVAQLADDVIILARGRLVTSGPLASLTDRAADAVHVRTPQAEELRALLAARAIPAQLVGPDQVVVRSSSTETVGRVAAEGGIVVYELRADRGNLEDVFLDLTATPGDPS